MRITLKILTVCLTLLQLPTIALAQSVEFRVTVIPEEEAKRMTLTLSQTADHICGLTEAFLSEHFANEQRTPCAELKKATSSGAGSERIKVLSFNDYWQADKFKSYLRKKDISSAFLLTYYLGKHVPIADVLEGKIPAVQENREKPLFAESGVVFRISFQLKEDGAKLLESDRMIADSLYKYISGYGNGRYTLNDEELISYYREFRKSLKGEHFHYLKGSNDYYEAVALKKLLRDKGFHFVMITAFKDGQPVPFKDVLE